MLIDENKVYQFVNSKRDNILSSVTIYVLRLKFQSRYSEDELDDILDLLVDSGKLKTNGTKAEGGMRSFWVRRDPDEYAPKDEKGGFLTPCSPGHSLKLLNNYMRTNLLIFIHGKVLKRKDICARQSPMEHIIGAINDVLTAWKGTNLFESFLKNPLHYNPSFDLEAEEDFNHDIKLMMFHLKALRRTLKNIEQDEF